MEFRNYQTTAIDKSLVFINAKQDERKVVIVKPTGSGKSWIIAGIANKVSTPIIVLQPSKELLKQNYEKYVSFGNKASIFSASLKSKEVGHVTFATIGSIKQLAETFKDLGVRVVLIDECHLASNPTATMGKFLKQLGKVKIIGLTATPVILMNDLFQGPMLKMVNRTRKSFFNKILDVTQIKEVIDQNYWADLKYERIKLLDEKLQFNKSRSEYTEESMEAVYEVNNLDQLVCETVEEVKYTRKSILIFCPSVDKAHELTKKIAGSRTVWGNMPSKEREEVIEDFKNHRLQVVINVNVLAIGFDFPELDCIIDTVPTASVARYYQKLGRVCRPHPNKKDGLIFDFSGNSARFGDLKDLTFEEVEGLGWGMFSKDRLLTNVAISGEPVYKPNVVIGNKEILFKFGKYKDKPVNKAPISYLQWVLKEVSNLDRDTKKEILKIMEQNGMLVL